MALQQAAINTLPMTDWF